MAQSVEQLPSAQIMSSGSWDGAPRQTPCSVGSLLLPLPLSLTPAHFLSNKIKNLKKKKKGGIFKIALRGRLHSSLPTGEGGHSTSTSTSWVKAQSHGHTYLRGGLGGQLCYVSRKTRKWVLETT